MGILGIVLTIATSGLLVCHGFPGKLSEQRYEFQQRSVPVEFEEEYIATTPEDIAQEVMAPPKSKMVSVTSERGECFCRILSSKLQSSCGTIQPNVWPSVRLRDASSISTI